MVNYRCGNCAKFPFCDVAPQPNCEKFIKRNYDTKLTKVDGLNYTFKEVK